MKILDRYVLISFLKNYLISFVVLVGMYIVLDLVFNFDDLANPQNAVTDAGVQSAWSLLRNILNYYFFKSFEFYVYLSGIIPVVAAAFTLIRLSRFNELVAIMAAGINLWRVALPIVLMAVVLQSFLVVDQELIIPSIIPKLTRKHDALQQESQAAIPIRAMQDDKEALLFAAAYHPSTPHAPAAIEELDVVYRNQDLLPVAHLQADRAVFDARAQQWDLTNGRLVRNLLPEQRRSDYIHQAVYKSNITPEEIALFNASDTNIVRYLSTARISELLARKSYGAIDLLRAKHARFTQPLINIILLLLAIPCVLTRETTNLKNNAIRLLLLLGLCMGCFFLAYNMAANPPADPRWANLWPALMAWTPIFIFGPLSVWLLERIKT